MYTNMPQLLDVFTAMGVLLTLENMDQARLEELNEVGFRDVLDCGMQFLLATSHLSKLAGRYVSMLQKLKSNGQVFARKQQTPHGPDPEASTRSGSQSRAVTSAVAPGDVPDTWASDIPNAPVSGDFGGGSLDSNRNIEFDFLDINFSDFLYGTGLPRDFISGQWPTIE